MFLENNLKIIVRSFMNTTPEGCIIKLITAIIYGFRNKLVFVPKHWTRLETLAKDKHSSLIRKS